MRDAFGGVFMMRLFLVFIVIYVAFTTVSLKYARAFRVKNSVISFVEENQITDLNKFFAKGNSAKVNQLKNILANADYNMQCEKGNGKISTGSGGPQAYCYEGVTIWETSKNSNTITYTVSTYAGWDIRSLNSILYFSGETPPSNAVEDGIWTISGEAVVRIRKK